jgi:myo-inositol 2-dehydrogenase/D-chiro-inositol 1-dehydrogenase
MDRTFEPTFNLRLLRDGQPVEVPIDKPSGEVYELVDQAAAFIAAIRDGSPPPCSGEDGRWSTAMCLQAARSVELGRPVLFSEC